MHGVRDNYAVLTDLINKIGHKVCPAVIFIDWLVLTTSQLTDVSAAQEKEFLNAYRVHMLNVQLELKELKNK